MAIKIIIAFAFLLSIIMPAHGDDIDYGVLIVDGVVSVHDTDSIVVDVIGVHPLIGKALPVELRGIDPVPYTGGDQVGIIKARAKARKYRMYLIRRLFNANKAGIKIELRDIERELHFGVRARVYIGDVDIGRELIEKGMGISVNKRIKTTW